MAFTPSAIAYLNRGGGGPVGTAAEILAMITGTFASSLTSLGTATGGAGDVTGTGAFQIPTGFRIVQVSDAGGSTLAVGGVSVTPMLNAAGALIFRRNTTGVYEAANVAPGVVGAQLLIRAIKVA